jgi:predicted metal-dependent TIM-barrel fold hydrolase
MAAPGIVAIVSPPSLGQPRTSVGSFVDYFNSLLGWERFRASQFGVQHFCTMGLNPKEANNPRLASDVLDVLPRFLVKDGVVAVGEIGFDDQTDAEERVFGRQIELAREFNLPLLVHTPHRDKKRGTIRSLAPSNRSAFRPIAC